MNTDSIAIAVFWGVILFALGCWFWKHVRDGYTGKSSVPTHVCSNCRSSIRPEQKKPGTGGVEVLLWLFFIVPGLIYTVWRSGAAYNICPVCQARNPVPLDTPAGKRLAA
jgi:hypothetical protein